MLPSVTYVGKDDKTHLAARDFSMAFERLNLGGDVGVPELLYYEPGHRMADTAVQNSNLN